MTKQQFKEKWDNSDGVYGMSVPSSKIKPIKFAEFAKDLEETFGFKALNTDQAFKFIWDLQDKGEF